MSWQASSSLICEAAISYIHMLNHPVSFYATTLLCCNTIRLVNLFPNMPLMKRILPNKTNQLIKNTQETHIRKYLCFVGGINTNQDFFMAWFLTPIIYTITEMAIPTPYQFLVPCSMVVLSGFLLGNYGKKLVDHPLDCR